MTEDEKNNPRSRMRALLAGQDEKLVDGNEMPPGDRLSPLARLPKKSLAATQPAVGQIPKPPQIPRESTRDTEKARPTFGPTFWTITGIFSLVVNGLLLVLLFLLVINARNLQTDNMLSLGSKLAGGLYMNFEKMDLAHIRSNIPVETTIPVKFDLQLNQQTNVVLSQDVTIDNALVTVQTGGLNITRARTTIVLPQGTSLPVILNLTVPVDSSVPVTINVPVDIPMSQTELHEPFVGLQAVIEPVYCMLEPKALNLAGAPVCE